MGSLALAEALRDFILERVLETPASFFGKLIIDFLFAKGYGGSRAEAGEHPGVPASAVSTAASGRTSSAWTGSTFIPRSTISLVFWTHPL
jgi:hypothetical protein